MGGFSNPVIGGGGDLIVASIQSPNYVPDTSGWQIARDGTSQFNGSGGVTANSVILIGNTGEVLVYSDTPAVGNLIMSISAVAGSDSYGNNYPAGLGVIIGSTGEWSSDSQISFPLLLATIKDPNIIVRVDGAEHYTSLTINGPGDLSGNVASLELDGNNFDTGAAEAHLLAPDVYIGQGGGKLQFFDTGGQYSPVTKPVVSGSKGGNSALTSLLTALASLQLITDSTT